MVLLRAGSQEAGDGHVPSPEGSRYDRGLAQDQDHLWQILHVRGESLIFKISHIDLAKSI